MTELATKTKTTLALSETQTEWDENQIAVLRMQGISPTITATELKYFLAVCQKTKLDPFARQIYLVGRWSKKHKREIYTPQTSIDGFRVIAERTGHYAGQTTPQWCGPDGQWRDVWLENDPPAAARIGVWRTNFREPLYAVALWDEYAQEITNPATKKKELSPFWKKMGAHMLSKVAESLALRKAFPQDLSGLYTTDEYPTDYTETDTAPETQDHTSPSETQINIPSSAPSFTLDPEWEQVILIALEDPTGQTFYAAQQKAAQEEPDNKDLTAAFRHYWHQLTPEAKTYTTQQYTKTLQEKANQ
jgi:phage recombination protein Bet